MPGIFLRPLLSFGGTPEGTSTGPYLASGQNNLKGGNYHDSEGKED